MIDVTSHLGTAEDRTLAGDVRDGLLATPRELPAKHLYDARGSELFEEICELAECYPTRAERSILVERYIPVDVSESALSAAAEVLVDDEGRYALSLSTVAQNLY